MHLDARALIAGPHWSTTLPVDQIATFSLRAAFGVPFRGVDSGEPCEAERAFAAVGREDIHRIIDEFLRLALDGAQKFSLRIVLRVTR